MLAVAALGGAVVLVLLRAWQGDSYFNYSEGVYALTSRLWLDGADLYGTMIAAQPPGMFVVGAGVLGVHDGLGFLRTAVGLVEVGGGVVAAVATWRLSGSRLAAALTPAVILAMPWTVHELGGLTPETLVAPLLLGGALLASRERTAAAGGAVAAAAVGFKLPFLLPLLGIVWCAADRRRAAVAAAGTIAAMVVAGLLLFGTDLVRNVIVAQLHSGRREIGVLDGVLGQAAWSLAGLVLGAVLLSVARDKLRDAALGRVWAGLSVGLLATVLTTYKQGTGLNVLVPVEAALVPVALSAVVLAGRRRAVAAVAVAFTLAQTAALLAVPARTVTPFLYPTSQRGSWGRSLDGDEVAAAVTAARACPAGVAYSGPPFLAFLADRQPPAGQPDGFLPQRSPTLAAEGAAIDAVVTRCP